MYIVSMTHKVILKIFLFHRMQSRWFSIWRLGDIPVEAWMPLKSVHGSGCNELQPSIRDEQTSVHGNFETFLQRGDSELGLSPMNLASLGMQ